MGGLRLGEGGYLCVPLFPTPPPHFFPPIPNQRPPLQEILNYISRKEFEPLLKVDQLNLEKEKHKVFLRFGEGAQLGEGGLWGC